ncbi:MAG: hypothetical protein CL873_02385 [Dehalococcoidales bacterium]|jgi:hypothetical protein|nr:hypothetical protein [Dehalococcoidales bacterium]
MVLWKIRSCLRCGGDTFLDIDGAISFDHCLQCGYMRRMSKEDCPKCGGDMFFDIVGDNWFCRCYQCGFLSKDRHVSTSQEYQRSTCFITSGATMTDGWITRKNTDRKPGRPKGSRDKKKRYRRRDALN